jgi:hypothetical protein
MFTPQLYFLPMFLFLVYVILVVICAEVSVLMIYFQLCLEVCALLTCVGFRIGLDKFRILVLVLCLEVSYMKSVIWTYSIWTYSKVWIYSPESQAENERTFRKAE